MGHHRILVPRVALWLGAFIGSLALAPQPVAAEGFLDLYLGAAFPQNSNVDERSSNPVALTSSRRRVDWETSPSTGLRGGYWFSETANFLGVGLDLSYYRAFEDSSFGQIDIYAMPITPLLMLRAPFGASEEYPGGRIQPYVAVGPGFTFSVAHVELSDLTAGLDDFDDAELDVGADARGGIAVPVATHLALFVEYRYTFVDLEYEDRVDFDFGPNPRVDEETELETHHATFGVSFRF